MRYQTNGIYETIKKKNLDCVNKYILSEEDKWLLVYGDEKCEPKIILIVTMINNDEINMDTTEFEKVNYALFKDNGLPIYRMRFALNRFNDEISISEGLLAFKKTNAEGLYQFLFEKHNIKRAKYHSTKKLNYATASPLQDWQREFLNATVVDFDIVETENSKIKRVIELKRSYINLDKWKPFEQDYPNFYLTLRFLGETPFYIIYNVRIKEPLQDIVNELSVFLLKIENTEIKIEHKGLFEFDKIFN